MDQAAKKPASLYRQFPDWLLIEQLYDRLPVPEELEAELADIEHDGKAPRVSARQFIANLPDPEGVEHLVTLSEPLMADIYRVSANDSGLRKAA